MATSRERKVELQRDWYLKNKQKVLDSNNRRRAEMRQWLRDYKSRPCLDCGVSYPPYVMDLDHREGTKKQGLASRLANTLSFAKLKAEVEKCDLVCSNCHRFRTQARLTRDKKEAKD